MAGLDSILAAIAQSADDAVKQRAQKAEADAAEIRAESELSTQKALDTQRAAGEQEKARRDARLQSAQTLKLRQLELQKRREAIDSVLEEALQTMRALPAEQYFSALASLILAKAKPENGVLRLSGGDKKRLPASFLDRVNAKITNGSLRLGQEDAPIDGGFLIVYGDIEENCSFEALLASERDHLSDRVNQILFSQE